MNGKTVNVQMESDMPWEGNIKIRVQAENAKNDAGTPDTGMV